MLYLTNAEENELRRLMTTTDEGVLGDEELLAEKGTGKSSVLGRRGGGGIRFKFVFV
jgi:hypothetical protein